LGRGDTISEDLPEENIEITTCNPAKIVRNLPITGKDYTPYR
jgi:hypothetical protein